MVSVNKKNKKYICLIELMYDQDLFKVKYEIDDILSYINFANKGTYALYLGTYHYFYITEKPGMKVKIKEEKENDFFKNVDITGLKEEIISFSEKKKYLYADITTNTGENAYKAIKRVLNLALHYKENKSSQLLEDILYGLKYIINNYYQGKENYSGNWWPYEIGIPRCLVEILTIIYNDAPKELIFKYLNIINFYLPNALFIFYRRNWPKQNYEEATYANLADNIYISLLKSIMISDGETIKYLFSLVKKTLNYTYKDDGFYKDGSFIQHKNIPYNASYGEVLLNSLAKILKLFKMLNFNINKYFEIIINHLKNSYEPFLYNHLALNAVRGRAISRAKAKEDYSYNVIVKALETLNEISESSYLTKLLNNLRTNRYELLVKSFNYMNRYVYRNNKYLVLLSDNSEYIANYEAINNENINGYYLSNGIYDIYYNNISPKDYFNTNPYYRNGSLNSCFIEKPNKTYSYNVSMAVTFDNLLNNYFVINDDIKANTSKFILPNSIVAVGNKISSVTDYHLTIYDSKTLVKDTYYHDDKVLIKVKKAKLEEYCYKYNLRDYNLNNDNKQVTYNSKRLIINNPKEYEYQLYLLYEHIDDDYNLYINDNSHILSYKNYLLINSFKEVVFNNIKINGKCSLILKYEDDVIYMKISTGKRKRTTIKINIDGYSLADKDNDILNITNPEEHLFLFRRTYEKN